MTETNEHRDTEVHGGWWSPIAGGWRRLRERWWARWAIDLTIAGLVFIGISRFQTQDLVETGERLPDVELETTDREHRRLADRSAERTLVYVWAPWCGVCDTEAGTVQWARSLLPDDISIRSVVFDYRSPRHARESAADKGIDFPVLLGTASVRRALAIDAFPTFYVVDGRGRVVRRIQGYTTTAGLLWRAWV